jgi:hypothetical protein
MCGKLNEMTVTILEDGTVKVETGAVGGPEHMAAERMLQWLASQLGGESTRVKRAGAHQHAHGHDHAHKHEEQS